ncbi:type III secretion system protein SctP [Paraburkholderia phosphatilytica]|uniref:type III secretion system protein SctP n=1 Tax=Paraburkholderia phosphatilytica TaxID=2282883 RepID=UPI000E497F66|nr:type III secretion system protein SctP [Paraburkholderia phosphatilytica]
MTDRARNARDIRIVPSPGSAAGPSARGTANSSAVQLFRALAEQASAFGSGGMNAADDDGDQASQQSEADAGTSGSADAGGQADANQNPADVAPALPEIASDEAEKPTPAATTPKLRLTAAKRKQDATAPTDDPSLGEHIVRACASAAHGEVLTQHLSERIARFCSMSGATDDAGCEVTLPLNPAVLPDTLLHLQLSPSRLVIRFETTDPRASRLIVDNTDALRARLADVLSRRIDVIA